MRASIAAAALLAACVTSAAPLPEYWIHPRNARATTPCATLFLDDGRIADAKFFATLAREEGVAELDGKLLFARLHALEGQSFYSEVERSLAKHPESAHAAGETMLRAAPDLADRGRLDAAMAVHAALIADPSLRPVAQPWLFSLVRAKMTPRNALDLLPFVGMVSKDDHAVAFLIEIARRAIAMRQPNIAAVAAQGALFDRSPRRPELGRILVEAARQFAPGKPLLAQDVLNMAAALDPALKADEGVLWLKQVTAPCGRGELLREYLLRFPRGPHARQAKQALERDFKPCAPVRFAGMSCGSVSSPFAGRFDSDERFFPGATYAPPLPPRPVPANAARREAQCRTLAPPLFPEAFDTSGMGRDAEEKIFDPDEPLIADAGPPCVEQSICDMVIGADGRVESVTVLRAAFPNGSPEDQAAIAAETRTAVPLLMRWRYQPGKIRGTPVRSITRGSIVRDCMH